MRAQAPVRRLRTDPIDDDTVLDAARARRATRPPASAGAASSSSCATPTSATSSPAPTGRAGRSTSASCARRSGDDALARRPPVGVRPLRGRPGARRGVPPRPPAGVPGDRRRGLLPARASRPCRTSCSPRPPVGLGGAATTLPLWSAWEARRTLGLPRRGHAGRGGRARAAPRASRPPRSASPRSAISSTSTATATSHFGPAPGTDGGQRARDGCRGIMVVTTSRQVTTCPEKDEHAASVKRAKLKQGYDDGLFREGSGTLADRRASKPTTTSRTTTTSTTTSKTKKKTGTPTTS